jgi:DNA polymerase III epsilon subunit-like protein
MILIIDVETIGIPIGRDAHYSDLAKYANARIVQFTVMICDNDYNEISLQDYIVKADNFKIENSHIHGITDEISANGVELEYVLEQFKNMLSQCNTIIAHNAKFDVNVIKSELVRKELFDIIDMIDSKKIVCTMMSTKELVNIRNKYGIKFPSLAELYYYLFDCQLENAHNSKYDVINLHKIVAELHKRQITPFTSK